MFGWGLNEEGQIGIGKDSKIVSKPTLIGIDDVIDISCGDAHNLALCISDGESKVIYNILLLLLFNSFYFFHLISFSSSSFSSSSAIYF